MLLRLPPNIEDSYRHKGLRSRLVRILREKGIKNEAVLQVMGQFPRHIFFDPGFIEQAYQDKAFPIGGGQTISQPYTVARQTELLDLQVGHKVLEIGTGSGYQCAILLELGAQVVSIEYNPLLFGRTAELLPRLGYQNATLLHGDGSLGVPRWAPYDRILVTAGAPVAPQALLEQLVPGGRLVIPIGDRTMQRMYVFIRQADGSFLKEDHGPFAFVPLLGKQGWGA